MDTLLATVCLPRWHHERGCRHHAAFPLPSRNLHSFAQSRPRAYPRTGDRKTGPKGTCRETARFLETVSAATGSPWPRWLLPACGSPRPLAITIANGIRLPVSLLVTAMREPVSLQTRCNLPGEMQPATCRHVTGFTYKEISFRSMSKPGRITAPGFVLGAVGRQGCAQIRMCMEAIQQGPPRPDERRHHKFRTGIFCPLNLRLKNPL
jgi:hypothetical protein